VYEERAPSDRPRDDTVLANDITIVNSEIVSEDLAVAGGNAN